MVHGGEAVRSLTVVKPIEGKGRGVVALRKIFAGEIIETAPAIPFRIGQPMPEELADLPLAWESEDMECIACGNLQFANHADDPNATITINAVGQTVSLVARKHIEQGDEVTIHYGIPLWFPPSPERTEGKR